MNGANEGNKAQLVQAWDSFTEQLRTLGQEALESAPNDAERLDGLRFLLRQLAYREEQFIEFPRGTKPEFFMPEGELPPIVPRVIAV